MTRISATASGALGIEIGDGIATLRLNRPERLNAMSAGMIQQLSLAAGELAGRRDVRVVVLTGAGRAFSAGADLDDVREMAELPTHEQEVAIEKKARSVLELLALPQLTIAAVNGACAGAAIGWVAACDIKMASSEAFFQTAYASRGLTGDFGVGWLLRRSIGPGRALDWLARPRRIFAAEAHAAGLLDDVIPAGQLAEAVHLRAQQYASLPERTLAGIVENVREAADLPLASYLPRETARHVRSRTAVAAGRDN
jgi:2-(1,2-epoxy-1,2-dihydrophenyl)acetyl-CoA isomerase